MVTSHTGVAWGREGAACPGQRFVEADHHIGRGGGRPGHQPGRVLLVDATVITQPASTGADWRLQTLFRLGDLPFAEAVLTAGHGGEGLPRFPLPSGDLVIADRGDAYPPTAAYAQACGAEVLPCWKSRDTGLRTRTGARFALAARLAAVPPPPFHSTYQSQSWARGRGKPEGW